jgi:2-oxoisovalerate dehydrogenase E1 component alpha subunit
LEFELVHDTNVYGEEMLKLLTPTGQLLQPPDPLTPVSDDDLAGMYRDMVLVRRIDTEAIALQRQGEMGLWTSLRGQEAAQIGAGRALLAHDMVFPSYREHGVAWCRGVDPVSLVELWRGSAPGGWDPHAFNFAPYVIVIGAQALHAVGYAMGVARDGAVATGERERDTAVLAFFGDGAMSQGDLNEAFVWAGAQNLPVVFFCQNNQWAISAPVSVQTAVPLARRAAGFGFPGVRVDGNDVVACRAATRAALDRARNGEGPTLIEAYTYRMNPHTTSDDATRYRQAADLEAWAQRDPIARVRAYLERSVEGSAELFASVDEEADKLAVRFRADVRGLADVSMESVFDNAYATTPPELAEQRHELTALLASFT